MNRVRMWDYLYFAFCLFLLSDGVLRKWVMPSYSTVIMNVKVMMSSLFVLMSFWELYRFRKSMLISILLGLVLLITTMIFGHGYLSVALYGLIPFFVVVPFAICSSELISSRVVARVLKLLIIFSVANSIVLIVQYYSPLSSWINNLSKEQFRSYSVGELAGLYRPPGLYMWAQPGFLQITAFVVGLYLFNKNRHMVKFRLLWYSFFALTLVSFIYMVTRDSIVYLIFSLVYLSFCGGIDYSAFRKRGLSLFLICTIFAIASFSLFRGPIMNVMNRIDNASESTGTSFFGEILKRNVVYLFDTFVDQETLGGAIIPFWGFGQGVSTQVATRILSKSELDELGIDSHSGFTLAEFDSRRIICESGLFLGVIVLFFRLFFMLYFVYISFRYRMSRALFVYLSPVCVIQFNYLCNWGNLFQLCFMGMNFSLFLYSYYDFMKSLKINTNATCCIDNMPQSKRLYT